MSSSELARDFCCELSFLKMRLEVGLDLVVSLKFSADFKKSLGSVDDFSWLSLLVSVGDALSDFLFNKSGSSSKEEVSSLDLSVRFPFSLSVELQMKRNHIQNFTKKIK